MTNKINGIDVSECEHYKNNDKCRIPRYQQGIKYVSCNCNEWDCTYKQLKRLQEENEELKKYQYTQEYLQSEIEKRQKALEEIRTFAKPIKENTCFGMYCGFVDWILETIDEVLNDRD